MSNTIIVPPEVIERVKRGATLLDEVEPSWFKTINERTLKMGDCKRCIVGQIAEQRNMTGFSGQNYRQLMEVFGVGRKDSEYGFDVPRVPSELRKDYAARDKWLDEQYVLLHEAWIREIEARRMLAATSMGESDG